MQIPFDDIDSALSYVSSQPQFTNEAILCRKTGRIYYISGFGDSDEDIPDDIEDNDQYISIPHKNQLDCGTRLVQSFIRDHAPALEEDVRKCFSRKHAYSRFKSLLESENMLQDWHEYEQRQTSAALREWCLTNEIDLRDNDQGRKPAT